ncbi:MAG: hypothetical protein Q4A78_05795 [Peptostreptococcaceae bacterium]|nr:hypothetical protein [Peptostreptococcaceae bacterium]
MDNKFKFLLAILQITVGALAAAVFVKNIIYGGKIEMTIISLIAMILGFANGIRSIRNVNRNQ